MAIGSHPALRLRTMDAQLCGCLLIGMAALGFFIFEDASATGHYQYYDITITPHNYTLTPYSINNLVEFTFTVTNNDYFTIRHDSVDSFRFWLLGENSNYKDISTREVTANGGRVTAGDCTANAPKPLQPGEEATLTACFWVPRSHEFNSLGIYEVTRAKGQILPFHADAAGCTSRAPICNHSQILDIPANLGQAADYNICNDGTTHNTFAVGGANAVDIVTVSGQTYALISSRSHHALQIIDVTNPANPSPVTTLCDDQGGFDSLKLPTGIDTATISGNEYVLAGSWGDNAVQIIDITNPHDPRPTASMLDEHGGFDALGGVDEITTAAIGGAYYAVIASNSDRAIQIADITNPAAPAPVASIFYQHGFVPNDVDLAVISERTYMIVTNGYDAVQIIDITNPAAPVPAASVRDGQHGSALRGAFNTDVITISGSTYAVVASRYENAVQIIDITNPHDPRPTASAFDGQGGFDALSSPYDVETVTISGSTYAVVASRSDSAIQIIDITNPHDPRPTASAFDGQGGFDALTRVHNLELFELSGHTYAVVSSDADSVQIVDITNPNTPVPAASIFDNVQPAVDSGASSPTTIVFDDMQAAGAAGMVRASESDTMLSPASPWTADAIFTVGETISGYAPPGVMDGIGAYELDDGHVRLLVNHELQSTHGYPYPVEDFEGNAFEMTGARISFFDIDKSTLRIVDAGVAYDTIHTADGSIAPDTSFLTSPGGFNRFCSGSLHEAEEFGPDRGVADTIYFTGEEFQMGAVWALNPQTGHIWHVPDMGRGAWENISQVCTGSGSTRTVGFVLSDDTPPYDVDGDGVREAAPLYLYIGSKDPSGDFLSRNGLRGGSLYVWAADDPALNSPITLNGHGATATGRWVEIDNSPTGHPSDSGVFGFDRYGYPTQQTLWERAEEAGAFQFSRPEDVSTNPGRCNEIVLASTGTSMLDGSDRAGTIYTVRTDFSTMTAVLEIIYDGDADPSQALRSPDNLDWADDGLIYIQEDRAGSGMFGDDAPNPNEAGIVALDPRTGAVTRIANIDRSVILDASLADPSAAVDVDAGDAGSWESSGILDVGGLFGYGTLFVLDVQAHGIYDQQQFNPSSRIRDGDLVEGGQLLFLYPER